MKRLYFIGIGGTAMGAVAGACVEAGFIVGGSDAQVYPPMSDFLHAKGIHYTDGFQENSITYFSPDIVVVGNAISRGNPELEAALDNRFTLVSMSELIRNEFIQQHTSIVITGTHGKTSTSSLAAWMFASAQKPTGFLIGAITGNFGLGCRPVPNNEQGYFISEGDEYDTAYFDKRSKFMLYRPDIAIINNIEFDHADIFSSLAEIKRSFRLFARLVPRNGVIIANGEDSNVADIISTVFATVETFGLDSSCYWRAVDIHYGETETYFTVLKNGLIFSRFTSPLAGEYNIRNTLAVIAAAHREGITKEQIQEALTTFKLPKRRLEEIASWNGATVVDDFAHHPTAIAVTLKAVTQRYPNRRIIACFEPRSNTTTRSFFQNELARCFDDADIICIGAPNRPERYSESDRLNTDKLAHELQSQGKKVFAISTEQAQTGSWGNDMLDFLQKTVQPNDVIVLLSNGDFNGLRSSLKVQQV